MGTAARGRRSSSQSIFAASIALGGFGSVCIAVVGPCAPAGASVAALSNNLSAPIDGTELAAGGRLVAASFSASGHIGLQLKTITMLMAMQEQGQAQLDLYTNISGQPGQPGLLATSLSAPTNFAPTLGPSVFSANSFSLQRGATYWAVLRATSGEFTWAWSRSPQGSGHGFLGTWGVSEDAGLSWTTFSSEPMLMKVAVATQTQDVPGPLPFFGAASAIAYGRTLRRTTTARRALRLDGGARP